MASPLVVYSDTTDGVVESNGSNYATVMAGSGLVAYTSDEQRWVGQVWFAGPTYYLDIGYYSFDTSDIPDDATVGTPTFTLAAWNTDRNDTPCDYELYAYTWGSGTLQTSDWKSGSWIAANLTKCAYFDSTGLSTGTGKVFTSTVDFKDNISKTGNSQFLIISSRFRTETEPTGEEQVSWNFAEKGTTYRPMLSIPYSTSVISHSFTGKIV